MNIFLKANNGRIFSVPFQYEQLTGMDCQMEQACYYKVILNTKHSDLPFHQIRFTLPYLSELEQLLNMDQQVYKQQLMIDLVHPKLCINTFCRGEFFGSQFFAIEEGQYFLFAEECCSENELNALHCAYSGFVVEAEGTILQNA